MFKDIMYIVIFFFCILGVVQAVKAVAKWLLLPHRGYGKITLIPFDASTKDAEFILRYEKLFCECKREDIYVLDRGMDDETKQICSHLEEQGVITGVIPKSGCALDALLCGRNNEIKGTGN
ncbi:MAG: hypothetical protein IJL87_04925 [Clostridia bacterium]|nr:hypothetical protein [Clostridia bacterium]